VVPDALNNTGSPTSTVVLGKTEIVGVNPTVVEFKLAKSADVISDVDTMKYIKNGENI